MNTTRVGSMQHVPSRQVLREIPARVVTLLRAIGSDRQVRSAMARGGFTAEDHQQGWELLGAVCRLGADAEDGPDDAVPRQAEAEIRVWVRTHAARLRVAIERLHPEHVDLFAGVEASEPRNAVVALATLLSRLAMVEQGAAANLEASHTILQTLSRRGLDSAERERLRGIVATAQAAPAERHAEPLRDPRHEELLALYRWYMDWSATARSVVDRKVLRIALGVSSRASAARAQAEDAGDTGEQIAAAEVSEG